MQREGSRALGGLLVALVGATACGGSSSSAVPGASPDLPGTGGTNSASAGGAGNVTSAAGATPIASTSGGTTSTGAAGPTEDGVRDPNILVEESLEFAKGLAPRDSTFGADADGEILWLFSVENVSSAPVCAAYLPVRVYDAAGNTIAGGHPSTIIPADGLPIFGAELTGSPYRDQRGAVSSCIAPGARGVGFGTMVPMEAGLDVDRMLADAARIEYTAYRVITSDELLPAPELLTITSSQLNQTTEGAVLTGTVSAGAALLAWRVFGALYDETGRLIDFVSTRGAPLASGESTTFELPPARPEATGFELHVDVTLRN